jgi:hypothetical protein
MQLIFNYERIIQFARNLISLYVIISHVTSRH